MQIKRNLYHIISLTLKISFEFCHKLLMISLQWIYFILHLKIFNQQDALYSVTRLAFDWRYLVKTTITNREHKEWRMTSTPPSPLLVIFYITSWQCFNSCSDANFFFCKWRRVVFYPYIGAEVISMQAAIREMTLQYCHIGTEVVCNTYRMTTDRETIS